MKIHRTRLHTFSLFALFCLVSVCTSAFGDSVVLIPEGSVWNYLNDGSNQGTSWKTGTVSLPPWESGPAHLGYGEGDEATLVDFIDTNPGTTEIEKNATTYFRKSFEVEQLGIAPMDLTVTYDDGVAVFINGIEVARTDNLPAGAAYTTYTTNASADNEQQTWEVPISVLQIGENTIAAEVHQQSPYSSDMSFDLELVQYTEPIRGPYLQIGTPTSIIVRWRTSVPSDSRVMYGPGPTNLTHTASDATITTEHEVGLSGLSPNTHYYYAIGTSTDILDGADAETCFVTPPPHGTSQHTRIWVIGDSGTADANVQHVRDAYYASTGTSRTDVWLMLGDDAYPLGTDDEYQAAVFDTFHDLLCTCVLWPTFGNHDAAHSIAYHDNYPYFDIFTLPTLGEAGGVASNTEHYYSFDVANIHFVCLDSQTADRAVDGPMHDWLELDLAQTLQQWIIAFWHHPPYSDGSHDSDTEIQLVEMRENFIPLLEAHGVDLTLTGHSHAYERSKLVDGFHATPTLASSGTFKDSGDGRADGDGAYTKTLGPRNGAVHAVAGSGGDLNIGSGDFSHPIMFDSIGEFGSMIVEVDGNRLDASFLNDLGVTRDYFTIIKSPVVSVTATISNAAEWGAIPGEFTIARTGPTDSPLDIQLTITGTATNGTDFTAIVSPITIPAASPSAAISILPVLDDLAEGLEEITLAVAPASPYFIDVASSDSVFIADRPMDQWRVDEFSAGELLDPTTSGVEADPDGDGLKNIEEYLFCLAPKIPDYPTIDYSMEDGKLTMTYHRRSSATDLTITPEVTGNVDATTWDSGSSHVDEFAPVDQGDGTEIVKVQDKTTGEPKRFMRLRIDRT